MITREQLLAELEALADEKYRNFNEKTVHTSAYRLIGVRMPDIKKTAKRYKSCWKEIFALPYDSFEEIVLKGAVLGFADADISEKEEYITAYAEMIDNWAECDCFCSCLRVRKSEEAQLFSLAQKLMRRKEEFVSRVGIVLMFSKFKDEASMKTALAIYDALPCGEYYRDMAVAWGISVYCVNYPQDIIAYLERSPIDIKVKKMAAQKIRDSLRIDKSVKDAVTETVNKNRYRT